MKTVSLGHSGIEVSVLCLGILPFGTKIDKDTSFVILGNYYAAGGRFIDTANNYSKWHEGGVGTESETMLGEWITARNNRNQLVIATKVGFNRDDIGPSLSKDTIQKEMEGSLKRLQTDYVDLFYAHTDMRTDPLEETLAAFNDQVVAGRARALGCSNYLAWRIEKARNLSRTRGFTEYCCVQQRFTYLRPVPGASFAPQVCGNDDLLDYCRENGDFRMLAYSPLLAGAYTRKDREIASQYIGPDTENRLRVLAEISRETDATPNQIVYAWMMSGTPGIIPLTAPSNTEQLEENLGSLEVSLTKNQIERLTLAGTG